MPKWSFRTHTDKAGKTVIYGRSRQPFKQENGGIAYKQVERSLGTTSKTTAERKVRDLDLEYARALNQPPPVSLPITGLTFAEAASTYMRTKGCTHQSMQVLLEELGERLVSEVTQDVLLDLADKRWSGCKPSTINRQIFSPVLAVINLSANLGKCDYPRLIRPKGHDALPQLRLPDERWFALVCPHMSDKVRALTYLLTLHGLRISEAIERTPEDFDPRYGTLTVPKTKTGEPALIRLAQPVIDAILTIDDWRAQKWLFGTRHRSNIARSVKAACKKAEDELRKQGDEQMLKAFSSHCLGRHSFATRLLKDGENLKFVQDAGRWKDIKMPAMRYGHLEKNHVHDIVKQKGAQWPGVISNA
jgi:integrase